jgi:hypothetical protein
VPITAKAYENISSLLWARGNPRWRSILLHAGTVYEEALGKDSGDAPRVRSGRYQLIIRWYAWMFSIRTIILVSSAIIAWLILRS